MTAEPGSQFLEPLTLCTLKLIPLSKGQVSDQILDKSQIDGMYETCCSYEDFTLQKNLWKKQITRTNIRLTHSVEQRCAD